VRSDADCRTKMLAVKVDKTELYKRQYGSTMKILKKKDDIGFNALIYRLTEAQKACSTEEGICQQADNLIELLVQAVGLQPRVGELARNAEAAARKRGATADNSEHEELPMCMGVDIKGLFRATEKTAFSLKRKAATVKDMAREGLRVFSFTGMLWVFEHFLEQDATGEIKILRIKDRLTTPTPGGWADVMINFYFCDDINRHICEFQIFHGKMFLQRHEMGGHDDYVIYRTIDELLEVTDSLVCLPSAQQMGRPGDDL